MTSCEHSDLTSVYRRFDADCANLANRLRSGGQYEGTVFVPTKDNVAKAESQIAELLRQAEALPAPDAVFQLLRTHFHEFLHGLGSNLRSRHERPATSISALTSFIDFATRKDSRPAEERLGLMLRRLRQNDWLWQELTPELTDATSHSLLELADVCQVLSRVAEQAEARLGHSFPELSETALLELQNHLLTTARQAIDWAKQAAELAGELNTTPTALRGDDATIPIERDAYQRLLHDDLGVDLEQLLDWHEAEVEKTRAEVLTLAARLTPTRDQGLTMQEVAQILNAEAGPCASIEEMFARGRDYVARAKEGCRDYVRLPAESCLVSFVPEQVRAHFPWGGYGGGCSRRQPLQGEMFLNETNYQAVTDGWLKMMAIHEGYPGHHVQFVRAASDSLPETFKMGARSTPLIEGAAHRSERVFEFVFAEDPYYPLFVAYRRHHTSVRIKAELYLRYFGRPIGDVVKLYMDELGFDPATARGQVKAQEMMVGYFNCYYYGLKRLLDLEKQYGFDEKSFTELLFSAGRISLASFDAFLKLSPTDKQRLQLDFASLLPR